MSTNLYNQSGFLSAAAGAVVLILFVSLFFVQRNIVKNTSIQASPTPSPSVHEVKFTNNTKHMTPTPVSTPSTSPSFSPKSNSTQSTSSPVPTPTNTPASSSTPSPSPTGRFIKIISPNGGEVYKIGGNIRISWEYSDLVQCVITYVNEDGVRSQAFVAVKPERKSYDLMLAPEYFGSLENAKVKIDMECYNSGGTHGVTDRSDEFFTVTK
jgi:hypothetical protein